LIKRILATSFDWPQEGVGEDNQLSQAGKAELWHRRRKIIAWDRENSRNSAVMTAQSV
jgi:hypothetical protein